MIGKVVEKSGVVWYNGFIKADNLTDKSEFVGGEIDMSNYGSCGIDCDSCRFKTEQNCTGCHVHKGQPFGALVRFMHVLQAKFYLIVESVVISLVKN